MSRAVDIVERLLVQKKPRHGAHPILAWCVANAVVARDPADGRKFRQGQKFRSD
jgi:phage terminase large subunit-like protein